MKNALFLAAAALLSSSTAVHAFQAVGGPACTTTNAPCSYSYVDGDGSTIQVSAFCSPNGFCADNGANCANDDSCYNYCGTDLICGGVQAACNTQDPFSHNQFSSACFTPGYVCSTDGSAGVCQDSGVQPSAGSRRRKRLQEVKQAIMARVVRPVERRSPAPAPAPVPGVPAPAGGPAQRRRAAV